MKMSNLTKIENFDSLDKFKRCIIINLKAKFESSYMKIKKIYQFLLKKRWGDFPLKSLTINKELYFYEIPKNLPLMLKTGIIEMIREPEKPAESLDDLYLTFCYDKIKKPLIQDGCAFFRYKIKKRKLKILNKIFLNRELKILNKILLLNTSNIVSTLIHSFFTKLYYLSLRLFRKNNNLRLRLGKYFLFINFFYFSIIYLLILIIWKESKVQIKGG